MDEEVEILRAPDAALVRELSLVLNSVGIKHRVVGNQHGQWIVTHRDLARQALDELSNYHRENLGSRKHEAKFRLHPGGMTQALLWCVVLSMFHILTQAHTFNLDWRSAGMVDGAAIRAGEWWRPISALCLHADVTHLVSNLAFGALFVTLLHQVLGSGLTWTTVILAGAAGNFTNAIISGAELRSLGASTAVFAALGALTAAQWSRKLASARGVAQRWIPLVAGLLLLGFNGMGGVRHDPMTGIQARPDDNTDVGAHIAGFVCGLAIGSIVWKLRNSGHIDARWEARLNWVAPLLLSAAWSAAFLF
ncbi:MAG: rhomboid protease GluP [Planctomycetota bacterium]|jgi:rhomboid protease GluP